jgi:hypothetical protein
VETKDGFGGRPFLALKFRKLALKSELAIFRRIIDMRMLMIVLTAVASVLVTGWAEAGQMDDPGLDWIKQKKPREMKDYYVVRQGESGKCFIVTGSFDDKPEGVIGDAPYASMDYAKTALKSSPECKGGLADDANKGSE